MRHPGCWVASSARWTPCSPRDPRWRTVSDPRGGPGLCPGPGLRSLGLGGERGGAHMFTLWAGLFFNQAAVYAVLFSDVKLQIRGHWVQAAALSGISLPEAVLSQGNPYCKPCSTWWLVRGWGGGTVLELWVSYCKPCSIWWGGGGRGGALCKNYEFLSLTANHAVYQLNSVTYTISQLNRKTLAHIFKLKEKKKKIFLYTKHTHTVINQRSFQ